MTSGPTAADYHGEVVTGKRWLRAYRVIINNPYLGVPEVAIDEEKVTDIDGQVRAQYNATLTTAVDLDAIIELVDPRTGDLMGAQMTMAQVYVAIYSVYRALGAQRDAAAGLPPPPAPPAPAPAPEPAPAPPPDPGPGPIPPLDPNAPPVDPPPAPAPGET